MAGSDDASCQKGLLETVRYLGTNAAGADAFSVKFQHQDLTYFIARPGPDGRIPSLQIINGSPPEYFASSPWAVSSPAKPVKTIYTRRE